MKIFRAAIEIKSVKISSRRSLDGPFFRLGDFSVKLVGDRPCDFTLNRKDIGYIPIVSLRPHVRVGRRLDELRVNSEPIADALDAAFQNSGRRPVAGRSHASSVGFRFYKGSRTCD